MKVAVVTGGTSFLGTALIDKLTQNNISVKAIVRAQSQNADVLKHHQLTQCIVADMDDTETWCHIIGHADYFFHLGWDGRGAAGRADSTIQAKNIRDAINCLVASQKLGCVRFLFAGSQAEYGPTDDYITEDTCCAPITEYGKAKLAVLQKAAKQAEILNMEYVHARIFSVYGPQDHPWALVPSCIAALCKGESIALSDCTQFWNFLHVRDAANALYLLMTAPLSANVYNVASTDTRVLKDFVNVIAAQAGKGTALYGGRTGTIEKPFGLHPSIERLQRDTKFAPVVTFQQGVRELIALQSNEGEIQ
ncbi:MAG: NAD(P)-dependent oxidoreductase [Ruthenibacterium sp.]